MRKHQRLLDTIARYPLELFQRVITVSLETLKIVRSLPELEIQLANC